MIGKKINQESVYTKSRPLSMTVWWNPGTVTIHTVVVHKTVARNHWTLFPFHHYRKGDNWYEIKQEVENIKHASGLYEALDFIQHYKDQELQKAKVWLLTKRGISL